jgi:hypothetical protein
LTTTTPTDTIEEQRARNKMNKWPENVGLFVNGGPDDDCQLWDIWHDGGPGGPAFDAHSEQMANGICSAIDELQNLRQENKQLILEREGLRREITELEVKLSQYHSLLDSGFDIINDHLLNSYGVWLDKATKLLQEEE